MEKTYDFLEEQCKVIDNSIEIFKKKIIEELNEKMPMYASGWRKEMNDIISSANLKN